MALTRRARTAVASALVLGVLASPTLAGADRADGRRPLPSVARRPPRPTQVPATDPDFVDVPLPTNPISPSVADVPAESAELDAADGALRAAEGRRDDAIAERDRLRRRITDLADERVATVDELARRRADEEQRGLERAVAVELHAQRIADVERAQGVVDRAEAAVERARDALRELLIANYMSESTSISDVGALLSGQGGVNDALVRLSLGESSLAARVQDVEDRLDDLADAEAARGRAEDARDRAKAARDEAEQAERDAIAAREGTEQHILDIDAESEATVADEAAAVEDVAAKEGGVLLALVEVAPARLRADVVGDGIDFPLVALDAWLKAAAGAPCRVEWWMLAGISKIEGNHGTYGGGRLGARGYPTTRIIGPRLDGTNGNALIRRHRRRALRRRPGARPRRRPHAVHPLHLGRLGPRRRRRRRPRPAHLLRRHRRGRGLPVRRPVRPHRRGPAAGRLLLLQPLAGLREQGPGRGPGLPGRPPGPAPPGRDPSGARSRRGAARTLTAGPAVSGPAR